MIRACRGVTSSLPPRGDEGFASAEDTREALPALTTPPPATRSGRTPLLIGLLVLVLTAAAATFVL